MRLPPSLLTEPERRAFAPWLRSVIGRSGKTKSAFAAAIGDDSTERLNRYLRGRIPTKAALRKIAKAGSLPYVVACWRAGYFDELIEPIGIFLYAAVENGDRESAAAAMLGAFACFPQRGENLTREGFLRGVAALEAAMDGLLDLEERGERKQRTRLPGTLGGIVRILRERHIDPRDRRDCAALVLRSLCYRVDRDMAQAIESEFFAPAGGAQERVLWNLPQRFFKTTKEV